MKKTTALFVTPLVGIFFLAGLLISPQPAVATTRGRVMKDFIRYYKVPATRKVLKIRYLGKKRSWKHYRGGKWVRFQAHKVEAINLFTQCGLKVRYLWDVVYSTVRGPWDYERISVYSHRKMNKPTKPLPALTPQNIRTLLGAHVKALNSHQTYKSKVEKVTVLKKQGSWNFCTAVWTVTPKVKFSAGEPHKNVVDLWECKMNTSFWRKGSSWNVKQYLCLKGGQTHQCYYPTHCRKLGTKSRQSTITWAQAKPKILASIKKDAAARRPQFSRFNLIKRGPSSRGGLETWFVIDARMKHHVTVNNKQTSWRDQTWVYIFDCIIWAQLSFENYGSRTWKVNNTECCNSKARRCFRGYCSSGKSCKLVRKGPLTK